MATTITTAAKNVIMSSGISSTFTFCMLLKADNTQASTSAESVTWQADGSGGLENTTAIVFDVAQGITPTQIIVYPSGQSATQTIKFDLTGGPFAFTTAGTFTIPIGDLTISVA